MENPLRILLALFGVVVAALTPSLAIAQDTAQAALGIVRNNGFAHLYYELTGATWRQARWSSPGYGPSTDEP